MNEYRCIMNGRVNEIHDVSFQVNGNSYKISYASERSNKVESLIKVLCIKVINLIKKEK